MLSLLTTLLTSLPVAPLPPTQGFEVEPRRVEWRELSPRLFDLDWQLPDARRAGGRDLLAEMERLVAARFEAKDAGGRVYRTLGDLARGSRAAADEDAFLKQVLASSPKLEEDWGDGLRELLRTRDFRSRKWDPDDDDKRDGLLIASAWDLEREGAPWKSVKVDTIAQQGAILIFADLATIKNAENDYRKYPDDPGTSYEEIYPVAGAYVRGADPRGNEFASLSLKFRCDLPLWYPDYSCDLRMLNRIDEKGRLVCDIYSRSKDFHWLAGRDVYLPLDASDGTRVAYLIVRQYGFDLDDVPDGNGDVRTALRGSLGNLRRRAEGMAGSGGDASADSGPAVVPEFKVRGKR